MLSSSRALDNFIVLLVYLINSKSGKLIFFAFWNENFIFENQDIEFLKTFDQTLNDAPLRVVNVVQSKVPFTQWNETVNVNLDIFFSNLAYEGQNKHLKIKNEFPIETHLALLWSMFQPIKNR